MPLYIAQRGDLGRCYGLTHSQTLKYSASQLLIKYKSGALVTQKSHPMFYLTDNLFHSFSERASFSIRSASNFSPCFSATRNLNEKSLWKYPNWYIHHLDFSGKGKVEVVEFFNFPPFPLFWVVLAALGAHPQIWSALPGVGIDMHSIGWKHNSTGKQTRVEQYLQIRWSSEHL